MSMPTGHVLCRGCDFKGFMQWRPITLEYVLPSGVVVQGSRVFAWCSSCDNIRDAEMPFDAASIQAEIDLLIQQKVGFFGRLFGAGKAEEVELNQLKGKLQLAQLRKSQPRCLKCGESTVTPLSFDESDTSNIIHTCGHRLYLAPENPEAARFMFRPEVIRLNYEGRKI